MGTADRRAISWCSCITPYTAALAAHRNRTTGQFHLLSQPVRRNTRYIAVTVDADLLGSNATYRYPLHGRKSRPPSPTNNGISNHFGGGYPVVVRRVINRPSSDHAMTLHGGRYNADNNSQ